MQIFNTIINTPDGEINHSVDASFDNDGNLHFTEHDMGSGVLGFWGRDEYEYFLTIPQKEMAKFVIGSFTTSFNLPKNISVSDLRNMCDELEIQYSTDYWM